MPQRPLIWLFLTRKLCEIWAENGERRKRKLRDLKKKSYQGLLLASLMTSADRHLAPRPTTRAETVSSARVSLCCTSDCSFHHARRRAHAVAYSGSAAEHAHIHRQDGLAARRKSRSQPLAGPRPFGVAKRCGLAGWKEFIAIRGAEISAAPPR